VEDMLETESSSISQTVLPTEILELSLNGRNPESLVSFSAGVVPQLHRRLRKGQVVTNPMTRLPA
jgi:hypothetical protein